MGGVTWHTRLPSYVVSTIRCPPSTYYTRSADADQICYVRSAVSLACYARSADPPPQYKIYADPHRMLCPIRRPPSYSAEFADPHHVLCTICRSPPYMLCSIRRPPKYDVRFADPLYILCKIRQPSPRTLHDPTTPRYCARSADPYRVPRATRQHPPCILCSIRRPHPSTMFDPPTPSTYYAGSADPTTYCARSVPGGGGAALSNK